MKLSGIKEIIKTAVFPDTVPKTSNNAGKATASCMLNEDLCRSIASYCDGVELMRLGLLNLHWKRIATDQFRVLIDLPGYKYLTLHRRHSISSIKHACWRIASKRQRNENMMCLFGAAYDSSTKVMCMVSDSSEAIGHSTVGTVTPQLNQDSPRTISCSACTSDCDGNILILGGWDNLSHNTVTTVRSFNTHDPAKNRRWTMLPPLCKPRCFGAAIALSTGDLLHIAGGSSLYVGGVCYSDTYIRKANTTDWQENLVPSVLQARYGHSALELFDGNIAIVGGYAGGTNFHNSVEMLSSSLDRWVPLPGMSVPRSAMAAVLGPSGSIYVAGGTLDGSIGHKSAERYDPREGRWAELPNMHVRRGCTTGCLSLCNNGFYVLGGSSQSRYNFNMEFYDFRMNQWTLLEGTPKNRDYLGRAISYLKLDL